MQLFKDVELATVVTISEIYRTAFKNHWGYAFIKRHHLDKAVRWGWTTINYANPWYWGRYADYHGGKEVAARLLMARIADLVGEEAVRLLWAASAASGPAASPDPGRGGNGYGGSRESTWMAPPGIALGGAFQANRCAETSLLFPPLRWGGLGRG